MNVLLVKMSSLGDIVHTLPAVHDAVRLGARFDWVVEENYRKLVEGVAGVDRALAVSFRRWRNTPGTGLHELKAFRRRLRRRRYDLVLDAQGLMKSALVGSWALAGERVGFDSASCRERAASLGYGRAVHVPRGQHAIARLRHLFAAAFGYPTPNTEPEFGLRTRSAAASSGSVVMAHGTTWPTKLWPEAAWIDLARRVSGEGFTPVVPWLDGEKARAERLAAAVAEAQVCPPMDLVDAMELISGAVGVVGVDSGLAHLAAALGRPTVMLFGPTDPALTGCRGAFATNLGAALPCSPCLSNRCRVIGRVLAREFAQRPGALNGNGTARVPPCLAVVGPDRVWSALADLIHRERLESTGR